MTHTPMAKEGLVLLLLVLKAADKCLLALKDSRGGGGGGGGGSKHKAKPCSRKRIRLLQNVFGNTSLRA